MKILYWVVGIVVVLVGGLAAVAATKPNQMEITRSTQVNAAPEKVFPLINDFRNWTQWSPWDKRDPNLERTYSGPESGVGTKYAWKGNDEVGQGEMTITESVPSKRVLLDLHFITPWEGTNVTEFTLNPTGNQTEVVWTMRGPSPFIMKMMSVVFDFNSVLGKDFETGLAAMKAAAERP
jgi:uncharacterized protein YndB with AHSA1/START domain